MERQLEEVKRKLSLEENKSAAAEEELNSVANKLAVMNEQLKYEQGQKKAAEEELENNLNGEKSKMALKRVQKSEEEKRKLELKLEKVVASERAKVAKEIQAMQAKEKEVQRQLTVEQIKVFAAEKALKSKEYETDELVRQVGMMTMEKVKMQSQLEGVKETFSIERSARAAGEKGELKKLTNQVEFMTTQLRHEQDLRKAAEDELTVSKCKQEEFSKIFQQMVCPGDTFLRPRQEQAEQGAVGEERMQGVGAKGLQASPSCKSSSTHAMGHDRLMEKLLKQIKQPPISPADCERFVQRLRASRGELSGLSMEAIEEEVRRMAMEEVEVKAKEPYMLRPHGL